MKFCQLQQRFEKNQGRWKLLIKKWYIFHCLHALIKVCTSVQTLSHEYLCLRIRLPTQGFILSFSNIYVLYAGTQGTLFLKSLG